jgi:hypothetical protein
MPFQPPLGLISMNFLLQPASHIERVSPPPSYSTSRPEVMTREFLVDLVRDVFSAE